MEKLMGLVGGGGKPKGTQFRIKSPLHIFAILCTLKGILNFEINPKDSRVTCFMLIPFIIYKHMIRQSIWSNVQKTYPGGC